MHVHKFIKKYENYNYLTNKKFLTMRYIFTSILAFVFTIASSQAQSLSLGAGTNNTSNGVHLLYSGNKDFKAKWQWSAGIRVMINTYALNNNYQNYVDYQTGYASNFREHLGIMLNGSRKILGRQHKWRVDAMLGFNYFHHSVKMKNYNYYGDIRELAYVAYLPARPNFEAGLGLRFSYDIQKNLQLYAFGMMGIHFYGNKVYGFKGYFVEPDGSKGEYIHNSYWGNFSMIGFEGLPMLGVGLRYQLNTHNKEKLSTVK